MKKIGRPTEAKKDVIIKARIDKDTEEKLKYCIQQTDNSKSQVIREGIVFIYNKLKGDN